jgi:DNA-binding CsgD family transcriptional regulator
MKFESQLFDFMKDFPTPVTFKEPKSGKYIFANESFSGIIGFESSDQLIGLTVHDLNFFPSQWGNVWVEEMKKMDWLVQEKKSAVAIKNGNAYLVGEGILRYERTIKTPFLGNCGKVLGIVTSSEDLTERLSHQSLYYLYKKICGKKIAIEKLLHHLEVESWFFVLPTEMELLVLLERATGKSDKEIARTHHVSTRTTETHLVNLRAKVKGNTLPDIVFHLKNRREVISIV